MLGFVEDYCGANPMDVEYCELVEVLTLTANEERYIISILFSNSVKMSFVKYFWWRSISFSHYFV